MDKLISDIGKALNIQVADHLGLTLLQCDAYSLIVKIKADKLEISTFTPVTANIRVDEGHKTIRISTAKSATMIAAEIEKRIVDAAKAITAQFNRIRTENDCFNANVQQVRDMALTMQRHHKALYQDGEDISLKNQSLELIVSPLFRSHTYNVKVFTQNLIELSHVLQKHYLQGLTIKSSGKNWYEFNCEQVDQLFIEELVYLFSNKEGAQSC
ncbi:hypothetical protein [Photobacterium leiognathi]|uniref:hypothetical protein n=1 Tax=Photobacterium leiognathi TaxID=553611 RepID=UPI0029826744|nr:hypothetical protein [Photobacterium leiognathi]